MPKGQYNRSPEAKAERERLKAEKEKEKMERQKLRAAGKNSTAPAKKRPGPKPGFKRGSKAQSTTATKPTKMAKANSSEMLHKLFVPDTAMDRIKVMAELLMTAINARNASADYDHDGLQRIVDGATLRLEQQIDNIIPLEVEKEEVVVDEAIDELVQEAAPEPAKKHKQTQVPAAAPAQAQAPFVVGAPFNPPSPTS